MKHINLILSLIVFVFGTIVFSACNNTEPTENNDQEIKVEEIQDEKLAETVVGKNSVVYTKYDLPLPSDLYVYLKNNDYDFNKSLLVPTENATKLISDVRKAINLGIYSSNLGYCTVFRQNQESLEYFETTQKISEDLNIMVGYNEEMVERFNSNVENIDSLKTIANEAYWKTCNYLEENQDANVLPFIIFGNWLESMYMICNSVDGTERDLKLINQVAKQKNPLDNLIEYYYETMIDIKVIKLHEDIQKVSAHLKDVAESYDKMKLEENDNEATRAAFNEIKEKINNLREFYTK